ncbi:hypothetical protein VKS41_005322 [Umbelopsis sp. WA50703]
MKILKPSGKEPRAGSPFSSKKLIADFKGLKTRSRTTTLTVIISTRCHPLVWQGLSQGYQEQHLKEGECYTPIEAAHVELGLLDASADKPTIEWAHGLINWSKQPRY